ncbi:MAG: aminotransferase class V-fold PLP-dependent enzyme [Clostridia bacterium]|nr:aminotransferase class V-fold PLP-dependent enzyme [Clostridia bacterium]
MIHYLDNSATTPLCDAAKVKINKVIENYGNPSSLHELGVRAQTEIENARKTLLSVFLPAGARGSSEQIVFTSGGTEANNIALVGTATSKPRNNGKKIIVGETEHSSVYASAEHLRSLGYNVVYIPSPRGVWDMDKYIKELTPDTILVSAMLVNNEVGAVNDISAIARSAKEVNPDVTVHCDAVQGFMRLPSKLFSEADLVSVSAHKIGAPKGTGALYLSPNAIKRRAVSPVVYGGGQEHGLRSGTENVIGIAAFGAAVEYYKSNFAAFSKKFDELHSYATEKFSGLKTLGVVLNIPQSRIHANHILSVTVNGIRSETLLHFLSSEGVYVSSGSACSSNSNVKSRTLKSFGLSDDEADSTVRFSFGPQNEKDDIDAAAEAVIKAAKTLSRKR